MSEFFKGETINNEAAANWPAIQRDCTKYPRFIIEVRKYDEAAEISIQQTRYLHAVVIKEFSCAMGESAWYVKIWLKREFGREMFMVEVCDDEERKGQIMFECQDPHCRHLFLLPLRVRGDKFLCPNCKKGGIRMFFMLSIKEKTVNDVTKWFESMWAGYSSLFNGQIERPNPEWRITKQKKENLCQVSTR